MHLLFYAAVFSCFFALYAATAQRGVGWQDSGEFQYRILAGDYRWFSGIARAHPLYIALARGFTALFPKAERLYAANLFSGVGLALALALLAGNVAWLTRSVRAAALAVGVLGFAHMAWWLGTVAEVYTWSLALLMAEVMCLVRYAEKRDRRWLIVLFGLNGAHFGLHNAALLGLPVYAYLLAAEVWRGRMRAASVVCGCAAAWLVGGGLIVWQAACLLRVTGDPEGVLKSVLFGAGYERQVVGTAGFELKRWAANMALAGVSLMNPCWLFAGRGFLAGKPAARGTGINEGVTLNAQRSTLNAQVMDEPPARLRREQTEGVTGGILECWNTGILEEDSVSRVPNPIIPSFQYSNIPIEVIDKGQGNVLNWLRALTLLHGVFWVRYFVADQATFVLPTLGLLAVWVGVGAGRNALVRSCASALDRDADGAIGNRQSAIGNSSPEASLPVSRKGAKAQRQPGRGVRMLVLGAVCAVVGPWALSEAIQGTGMTVARGRVLPFRNEVRYWLLPWKQREASAERFVTEVGRMLHTGDTLVADSTSAGPLMAARQAGLLSADWRLITPWTGETDEELRTWVREGGLRVYVVSPVAGYAPAAVLDAAAGFERTGVVYRAIGSRQ